MLNWDFKKISTVRYETTRHEIEAPFTELTVITDTADIVFLPSEDGKAAVVCREEANAKHSVDVQNGALTIEINNRKKWYENISINFESPRITVYLPLDQYGTVTVKVSTGNLEIPSDFHFESCNVTATTGNITSKASVSGDIRIKTSTGNIFLDGVSTETVDLSVTTGTITATAVSCSGDFKASVSTGKMNLSDITCKNLSSVGSTGSIRLTNVIASGKLSLERSTGRINLEACDAVDIFIKTDTGDISGTLLSGKIFIPRSDTGDIKVPENVPNGTCEIISDTGDIHIRISE